MVVAGHWPLLPLLMTSQAMGERDYLAPVENTVEVTEATDLQAFLLATVPERGAEIQGV